MCGIMGYIGGKNAARVVYDGLCALEYRGYDSAGIAVIDGDNIKIAKRAGRVEKLAPEAIKMQGSVGIGHTRWATHGAPTDINAHPHEAGGICIVHNGIIENYACLKALLEERGERFISETDTEVIVRLIGQYYGGNLLDALNCACKMLKGTYALMAIRKGERQICVARYCSPVILGFGSGEYFCASDEPALAGKCDEVCCLEDGDFARITEKGIELFDGNLKPVKRPLYKNRARPACLDLYGYPHYMLKELGEAPAAIVNTAAAFSEAGASLKSALSGCRRAIFSGCGTAYHAALAGKRYFEHFARIPSEAEFADEFRYKQPVICRGDALFAISQSGETADTLGAARLAKELGAKVIAVTNSPFSALTKIADVCVPVAAGQEICVAATKSYSAQLAALYLSAAAYSGGDMPKFSHNLSVAAELCGCVIKKLDVSALVQSCIYSSGVYFIGRDLDYSVALEASLKLKEVSYIRGEGFAAGELKHGPLALIDDNTLVIAVICDGALAPKSVNAVKQVISRGGKAAVVTTLSGTALKLPEEALLISLPACDKFLSPIVSAAALHLLAYRVATASGKNPDKPRNLAKSVTVE